MKKKMKKKTQGCVFYAYVVYDKCTSGKHFWCYGEECWPVRITSWYPKFNGCHFGLSPSSIHKMTRLVGKMV